ncbi:MAG: DUF1998 domain-containing protein, partial [Acidobacteriota bacterium]
LRWLVASERHPAGSLHAMEHAAIGLFPLLAICDRWDLGGISYAHHPQIDVPAVFIYDGWPGGVGLAKTGYERAESLVDRTHALIADCPCEDGCPACIHSPKCGSGNTPLDKLGAVELLDVLRGVVELEPAALAAEDRLAEALSRHRRVRHVGVRGGEPLPDGFFAGAGTSVAPGEPDGSSTACEAIGLDQAGWPAPLPPPSQLLGPEEGSWLFFDVETLRGAEEVGGWGHIADMGLALAVVLEAREGRFETFWERDVERLFERLAGADRVVGFNVERFDLAVLSGYIGRRVKNIRTLDLLKRIRDRLGFRLGLGHLVEQTLGVAKTADGLQSLQWVREGRFDEIERYCRDDVMLTAALWAYGRQHGYVLFRNRDGLKVRIPVSW